MNCVQCGCRLLRRARRQTKIRSHRQTRRSARGTGGNPPWAKPKAKIISSRNPLSSKPKAKSKASQEDDEYDDDYTLLRPFVIEISPEGGVQDDEPFKLDDEERHEIKFERPKGVPPNGKSMSKIRIPDCLL